MSRNFFSRNFLRHGARQFGYLYLVLAAVVAPLLVYTVYRSSPGGASMLSESTRKELEHDINEFYSSGKRVTPDMGGKISKISPFSVSKDSSSSSSFPSPKPGCIIPKLNLQDPDIVQFYKKFPPVSCGSGFDWVSLRNGKFSITPEAKDKYGNDVACRLTPLVKKTDFQSEEGLPVLENVKDGSPLQNDFYKVECTAKSDGSTYRNYHSGINRKPEVAERLSAYKRKGANATGLDVDVIILGQDSMSRMAWTRHLPLTRQYLVHDLGAIEMEGHTVVGDGTPATMFPMLTGKREEELPEARRGFQGAKTVDGFPWIWKNFQAAGYATSWQEDEPGHGTFHYRLLGFQNNPTDHYYRPFLVYTSKRQREFKDYCLGSKPRIVVENDYITDVLDVYKGQGQRKWVMSFKSENSHQDNNFASRLDVHMLSHLKELKEKGHLDTAILVMFADHGARFSKIRAFAQGKQEERMPYLAIRIPDSIRRKHPQLVENLRHNSQRLTTPFDVHETFHEILNYTGPGLADVSKRGVSLFKKIPIERDCKSADIDPHWCFCLDWFPVPVKSEAVQQAVSSVVQIMNQITERVRGQCHTLTLSTIKSANEMKVKDDVLRFKDTNDGGRGRFGKMNDGTKHSKIVYQVTFVTSPGDGEFEATVTRDIKTNTYSSSLASVSRINQYGNAPWCTMEEIPQLRPYCVCKQPPPAFLKEHR